LEIVKLLIEHGAPVDGTEGIFYGAITPVFATAQSEHFGVVKVLLDHGGN
jgi:hypothetical protein